MKFVKVFKHLNLFQPQKAKKLSEVKIDVGDNIVCLNEDNSIYGICGAIDARVIDTKMLSSPTKYLEND